MNLPDRVKLWETPIPDVCIECLGRLIDLTVREATQDEALRKEAVDTAHRIVKELREAPSITPAQIANRFHPVIKKICNNADPFKLRKIKEMLTAKKLAEKYLPRSDRLEDLVVYALMGNSIDFFRDISELEAYLQKEPNIVHNDIPSLVDMLLKGGISHVVMLADNAGEVYFDAPLLEDLSSKGFVVFYAVKAAPVQNDLSMDDIIREGLKDRLGEMGIHVVSTGIDSVGFDYDQASVEFRNIYDRADVVIAKGMGHLETLGKVQDERLFFLFEAKCPTVASTLGLSIGDFVACWKKSLEKLTK